MSHENLPPFIDSAWMWRTATNFCYDMIFQIFNQIYEKQYMIEHCG